MARKPKRPPLTRKRQAYAERRRSAQFFGTPLTYPAVVEDKYTRALERPTKAMIDETRASVAALYDAHAPAVRSGQDASMASQARILTNKLASKFEILFQRLAPGAAKRVISNVEKASKSNLHASLSKATGGLSLKTSVISGRVREIVTASTAENVGLIKSIPRQYFDKIQGTVMRAITSGQGQAEVLALIDKIGHSTTKRARLIARDQTRKATTAINAARMQDLGIRKFEWLHSDAGKEPRKLHVEMSGNIYDLNDPPVIDEDTGERGLPGQLINCRCRMCPVIDFGAPTP